MRREMRLSCKLAAPGDYERKGTARIRMYPSSSWDSNPATLSHFPPLGPREKWEDFPFAVHSHEHQDVCSPLDYVLSKFQHHGQSKAQ